MSLINVDLDILDKARQEIDDFLEYEKNQTNMTNIVVEEIGYCWKGVDYTQFKSKWEEITNDSSIYHRTQREFQSMSSYLSRCYTDYTTMQSDLKNIAMGING